MKGLLLSVSLLLGYGLFSEDEKKIQATSKLESIILGSGCFWGEEKRYESIPGVVSAISGYADGKGVKPTYREITKPKNRFNSNNHAEVVLVVFDRNIVSVEEILKDYFEGHDPTQFNRQGNDIGTQYRSVILTINDEQRKIAKRLLDEFQFLMSANGYGRIQTKIKPLTEFHYAEEYHQDYLVKNPNGYCPDHSTGVVFNKEDGRDEIDNSFLQQGKHIVVVESDSCPYCEKFKATVAKDYMGNIPFSFRLATQLEGLTVESPTWATPTILFLEDGKEVFGHQGYMSPKEFYEALGFFKLGNSEAYRVAFNDGTDARFCKEYEIFKNTPDGLFIDKLSGAPLFDTRDRFNSSTGWLSFTKPIDGSVYTKPDNSYGMRRTEIRSTTSDIHLGHVFPDGPQPTGDRYCMNSASMHFKSQNPSD